MNFEERLSQTQAKLDELKAKINESIDSAKEAYQADKKEAMINMAKMNAAIEDFGRDVQAQVYCDVTSMKEEAKADADAVSDALEDLGAKITDKAEKMDKSLDDLDDKIEEKIDEKCDKLDQALASIDEKIEAKNEKMDKALSDLDDKIDDKIDEHTDKYNAVADEIQAAVDDGLATVEGDVYAAKEDLRIAKERYNGKLNAIRLKVQMHQEQIKAKIEAKKTAIDKAAQEELIMDLLDYADDCQMIAYAYAMEAELAIMDACDEIEDYEAKYGKLETEEE